MPHDMTIADALSRVRSIRVDEAAPPVVHTAAAELAQACDGAIEVRDVSGPAR